MSITITLPPHVQSYIQEQLDTGRYESEQDVIVDVFEQVMHEYDAMTDPKVLEAIAQTERGETRTLTLDVMQELFERAKQNARLNKPISDDVKY